MSRWDITDPDRVPTPEVSITGKDSRKKDDASPSVGRGGATGDASQEIERAGRRANGSARRPIERRSRHENRGRTYSLRSSEITAMADMGRFRAVDVRDLARFAYHSDEARMIRDLEHLRRQGLLQERTVLRAHKPARKMVTLTRQGHEVLRSTGELPESQRAYHGFVKPKELDHDADLYRVYQKAVEEIEKRGGHPLRVRLDFELKESINRAREEAGRLPENMRKRWLAAVAEENGLRDDGTTIHLPDLQVEYETSHGRIERENLELLSRNYREDGIRGKAAAGFTVYARASETGRIRRALQESGLVREVLSI